MELINEAIHVLSDPAHILSEIVWEATFLLIGVLLAKRSVRREHKILDEEHGVDHHAWFFEPGDDEPIPYTLTDKGLRA